MEEKDFKELVAKVSDATNEKISKEVAEAINGLDAASKKDLEGLVKSEDVDSLKTLLNEVKEDVSAMKETGKGNITKSLAEQIAENKEAIKGIASRTSNKEVVIQKALTNRAAIANNEQAVDLPDVGQLAHRRLTAYDVFPKLSVGNGNHNGTIRYYDWDEDTIARAAASVAEGAAFPESTAKFKKGAISLQKIGDTLPVTEEFFEDEQMFAAELDMFLQTNVALEIDDQIINGDGTSNTLTGLITSAPAYTAAASGITDANIFDLLIKVKEDISVTGGSKYNPDIVLAPQSVVNQMKLKKDANNNYVMPPYVDAAGQNVDGMQVIVSNVVPADTLVVCDRRFGRIYEMGGVELSRGTVNAQFTEDELTLKARKRLAFLIREADKGGFRKVSGVAAALTTLAT